MPSVTIQQAIYKGIKIIVRPAKVIFVSSILACLLVLMIHFSLWDFLLLPAGAFLSFLYTISAIPRWKIWAYGHVDDIWQLQRSAELAGIILRQPYESTSGIMNGHQKETLKTLQKKFSENASFTDDSSIPNETRIYRKTVFSVSNEPLLTLSNTGIQLQSKDFCEWDKIEDEHIAEVSFSGTTRTGTDVSAGTKDFFRFESPAHRYEIPISSLNIKAWQLDLFVYIYRGRFSSDKTSSTS